MGHGIPLLVVTRAPSTARAATSAETTGPRSAARAAPAATPAPSREDDPHHPVSVLGETKSLAESVAVAVCGDRAPLTVVRPQNVIGPGQALHNPYSGVLAAFLAMLRERRPLTIYGDGHPTRDCVTSTTSPRC